MWLAGDNTNNLGFTPMRTWPWLGGAVDQSVDDCLGREREEKVQGHGRPGQHAGTSGKHQRASRESDKLRVIWHKAKSPCRRRPRYPTEKLGFYLWHPVHSLGLPFDPGPDKGQRWIKLEKMTQCFLCEDKNAFFTSSNGKRKSGHNFGVCI